MQNSKSFDELKQLSRFLIAMNVSRNGNKGVIASTLLDYYKELTRQPWLATLVGQIREGKDPKQVEMLKKQLPFRSPHYFHFLDDHRAQKSIDPESFTFQTTIDIDNPEEVEQAVKKALLLNGIFFSAEEQKARKEAFTEEDLELWQGKVLHVERSARNKAHIDIRIPVGMTIAEAQSAFCKLIGATEDESCVTPERIIFITDAASEIYVADDWYRRLSDETIAEYREAYRKRGLDIDGRPLQGDASTNFQSLASEEEKAVTEAGSKAATETVEKLDKPQFDQTYDGVPYAEVVKALVELMGGAPAHGARNNFIYREACLLRYICNNEAALMNLLVSPMSSGKSLVNGPIDCIMQDMVMLDQVNRDKEQEWKDEVNTMGDNKKKPVRPEGICIRIVSPDLTRAAYIQRLDDAQKAGDAYLYCKMDEVDMLKKFNDPSQLIRLCWDNSVDGQERVGSKSVTARVKTRFNWNASSTIAVTQKFFTVKEVADGAVSRLNLCTIIRDDFAPRPVVGEYDAQFKASLRPFIDYLNGAHGVVDCKKARQLAERLEAEVMEIAQLADNKSYAEFAKRALANGYRKAMVLYLANGEKWEKSIEDFIEWSVKYDLWCKMRFFSMKMDEAIDSDRRLVNHSGPNNLLSFVPDTFSLTDIQAVYQMQGKKGKLTALLAMWVKRGHITKNADGTYSKTERFIAKYGHFGTPVAA